MNRQTETIVAQIMYYTVIVGILFGMTNNIPGVVIICIVLCHIYCEFLLWAVSTPQNFLNIPMQEEPQPPSIVSRVLAFCLPFVLIYYSHTVLGVVMLASSLLITYKMHVARNSI